MGSAPYWSQPTIAALTASRLADGYLWSLKTPDRHSGASGNDTNINAVEVFEPLLAHLSGPPFPLGPRVAVLSSISVPQLQQSSLAPLVIALTAVLSVDTPALFIIKGAPAPMAFLRNAEPPPTLTPLSVPDSTGVLPAVPLSFES